MKLHEYRSKELFVSYGIPVPKAIVATTLVQTKQAAIDIGGEVVVKAQVLSGGRGKGGGIKRAKNGDEAEACAKYILGKEFQGLCVKKLLIEEYVPVKQEIYLSVTIDYEKGEPVIIASALGGVDIEEMAIKSPLSIQKIRIDPLSGYKHEQGLIIARSIGLPERLWTDFSDLIGSLWQLCKSCDATLAEINPLGLTKDGRLIALDAKIILDDNALFRQPGLKELRDETMEKAIEVEASKQGLAYIQLGGEVGSIVNGAGLAMAIMDMIEISGDKPGNFLDIGGGASEEKVYGALRLLLTDRNIKIILINIFGGITRCDIVANGIIKAVDELSPDVPIVVHLAGTNAEAGIGMLSQTKIISAASLKEAAQHVSDYLKISHHEHSDK